MNAPNLEIAGAAAGRIARRKADGSFECVTDEVTVEEPLEIRIGHESVAVTMRTPGDDVDLAAGFLLSEAIIKTRTDLQEITHSTLPESLGNIINVTLSPEVKWKAAAAHRFGTISSSCGLCGKKSIDLIRLQFSAIALGRTAKVDVANLLQMPEALRSAQKNFARTGGIHAAAIFDVAGNLIVLREDVGRHNAVDKAIGALFRDGRLPLGHHVLLVSGRCSLEIVQKALAAGIPMVASISAPSTLAVNFAREVGQTLVCFLRPPIFNVYSHIERLALGETIPSAMPG